MSPRTVFRFVDCAIRPEAAPVTFEFGCTSCVERGPAEEDFETARDWTFQHLRRNPSHTGYREIIHRFWRITPNL